MSSNYLDGKKVAAWIEAELPHLVDKDHPNFEPNDTLYRAMYGWKVEDKVATIWRIDEILTANGRHLYEIPDDYYVEYKRGPNIPKETIAEALQRYQTGEKPLLIAKDLDISVDTIHKERRKAGIAPIQGRRRTYSSRIREAAIKAYEEGYSSEQVAAFIGNGLNGGTVRSWLHEAGVPTRQSGPHSRRDD